MIKKCRNCQRRLKKGSEHLKYCSAKCLSIAIGKRESKKYERIKRLILETKASYRYELHKKLKETCIICGTTQKTVCHEINGRKHPNLLFTRKAVFEAKGFKFCLICRTCHTILHLLAKRNLNSHQLQKLADLVALISK